MEKARLGMVVETTVRAVSDAVDGSLVTFRAVGPGEKLDRNDPQSKTAPMWLACKVSPKRTAAAAAVLIRKGDTVDIRGNLVMGAPWTSRDGDTRQDLVLWVNELWIHGMELKELPAEQAAQPATSYDDSSIPF